MSRRVRKEEPKPQPTTDLTRFFGQPPEQPAASQPLLSEEVERMVLSYIRRKGRVTKSELYKWSKDSGIKPAAFYSAVTSLLSKGLISRSFDPEKEEYVFSAK
jgi:DNA-binding MarR family transcriptional regulator